MPNFAESLATIPFPEASSALEAAESTQQKLAELGHDASVLKKTGARMGVALIRSARGANGNDVVLVHTDDAETLRDGLRKLTALPLPGAHIYVHARVDLPEDVELAYGSGPIAELERALTGTRLSSDLRSTDFAAVVREDLVPLLKTHLDLDLDPSAGTATLRELDALLLKLRPAASSTEAVPNEQLHPHWVLVALGLVASETVAHLAGDVSYGQLTFEGWSEAATLGDSHGFPAITVADVAQVNAAQKLTKRWYLGEAESVHGLWELLAQQLPSEPTAEDVAELSEAITLGLSFAGKMVSHAFEDLAESGETTPVLWVHTGESIAIVRLMAANSERAQQMADQTMQTEHSGAKVGVSVVDALITPHGEAQTDALIVRVIVPGQRAETVVAIPYAKDGEALVSRRKSIVLNQQGVKLSADVLSKALFDGIPTPVAGLQGDLTRELEVPDLSAMLAAEQASSSMQQELSDEDEERIRKLAALAPFAGFAIVAAADGEIEEGEVRAFADGMDAIAKAGLRMLTQPIDLEPDVCVRLVTLNMELGKAALHAAGWVFEHDKQGPLARQEFDQLMHEIAAGGEEQGGEELMALVMVAGWSRGPVDVALKQKLPQELANAEMNVAAAIQGAIMGLAAEAPYAGMLKVAAADGTIEPDEMAELLATLNRMTDPLLVAMMNSNSSQPNEIIDALLADEDRQNAALRAAGMLFKNRDEGEESRAAMMRMLRDVAETHGEVRDVERAAIEEVERILDEQGSKPWFPRAVLAGILLFLAVAGWQFLSALVGLTAVFVPVAIGIQLVWLSFWLFITSNSQGYIRQVLISTFASVGAAFGIALSSLVVSAIFPSAVPEGTTALQGAIGGFIGTSITGVFIGLVVGLVFRKR